MRPLFPVVTGFAAIAFFAALASDGASAVQTPSPGIVQQNVAPSPGAAGELPFAGVSVSLVDVSGKQFASVVSDGRGVAIFRAVPPGPYRVTARVAQPQTQAANLNMSKSNVNIMIGSTPVHRFETDLSGGKTFSRDVTAPPGAPQPMAVTLKGSKSNSSE